MSSLRQLSRVVPGRVISVAGTLALALCGLWNLSASLSAAPPIREQTSLRFVPDDVAIYGAAFRLREQFDELVHSRAFARLRDLPFVQETIRAWRESIAESEDESTKAFFDFWRDPKNVQLLELLIDAASHEAFLYGDGSFVGFLERARDLNSSVSTARLGMLFGGEDADPQSTLDELTESVVESLDGLKFPNLVIGFKLTDRPRAVAQLGRLERLLRELFEEYPAFEGRLKREKVGDDELLTLQLDGSMIPWDEFIENQEQEPMQEFIGAIAEKLKGLKAEIALALHGDYLLVSMGETTAHLARLRSDSRKLADRPELAPVISSAEQRITGISFTNGEAENIATSSSWRVDDLLDFIGTQGEALGLEPEQQKTLAAEIETLQKDAERLRAEPSAVTSWSYRTPRGYETYSYRWRADTKTVDASKRLSILDHVGGNPLIVVASRSKGALERFEFFGRVISVTAPYLDQFLREILPLAQVFPEEWETQYARFKTATATLPGRFQAITRNKLIPALADGQSAFVFDAGTASNQWHSLMPASPKPLPFPGMALVYGVSDAALLRQATQEYFALLQDLVNAVQQLAPDSIPEFVLPPPSKRETKAGTAYLYSLTGNAGDSSEIAPVAALNDKVAVLSLLPDQSTRLLTQTPFAPSGVLARRESPASSVWHVNVAGFVDFVSQWIDYVAVVQKQFDPDATTLDPANMAQVKTVLDFISCFRSSSSTTYVEGTTQIEFQESVFEDLK